MLIQVLSDIHLEVCGWTYDQILGRGQRKGVVLCIVGDLTCFKNYKHGDQLDEGNKANYVDFMTCASEDFDMVLFTPGNHDFWGMYFNMDALRRAEPYWEYTSTKEPLAELRCFKTQFMDSVNHLGNVYVLVGGDFVIHENVMFVGATTWTHMNKGDPILKMMAARTMNDFARSKSFRDGQKSDYTAQDWLDIHDYDWAQTRHALAHAKSEDMRVVLLNHHAPGYESIDPAYHNDITNWYYHNDDKLLSEENVDVVHLLLHGHVHCANDYFLRGSHVRVVCNPMGYQGKNHHQTTGFVQHKILNTEELYVNFASTVSEDG